MSNRQKTGQQVAVKENKFVGIIKKFFKSSLALPVCALIAVIVVSAIITGIKNGQNFFAISIKNIALPGQDPKYVLYGSIIDILNRSSELIILSLGMTLVVASSRGTDISVGSVMAISGAIIVRCLGSSYDNYAMYPVFAILLGILAGVACGAFNGFLVANLNIQPMVATLILFTAGRGIAQIISSTKFATGVILYVRKESFKYIGGFMPNCVIPTPILIAALCVLLMALFLRFTAFSTYVKTVGINPKAGRLVGLNSALIIFMCYVICGLCSGVSGMIASSRIYSSDANNIGLNKELDAILAVALGGNNLGGGKFSIAGSVIGAITIQALTISLYSIGVPANQLPVYKAIVVILIVLFQSPRFRILIGRIQSFFKSHKKAAVKAD